MSKEKFERSKPHVNISDIKTVEHGKTTTNIAFQYAQENYERYEQWVLRDLINTYGLEEGERRFEILKQEAMERYNAFKNIDSAPEEKEDGVNFSRGR